MVKSDQLLQPIYPMLDDIEIISAISYCNKLLERTDEIAEEEFRDFVFFFFNEDEKTAIKTLQNVSEMYVNEFSKRHIN